MATLRITSRPAYELLLTLVAHLTPGRVDSYEVGRDWFETVEAALDDATRQDVQRLFGGCEHMVVRLLEVARQLPPPADAEALVEAVETLAPRHVRLTLLGFYAKRSRQRVAPATIEAAADGDRAAGLTLVRDNSDGPECERGLAGVLSMSDDDVAAVLVQILRSWNERVFAPHIYVAGPIIEREAERLRGRSLEISQHAFLAEATNGADVVPAPGVDEIEVFPTWVLRPWDVFCEQDRTMLIGVGVAGVPSAADPDAPPDRLVRLTRALGDERRLRILRRLVSGAYTLQELADQLRTPKTTLLHHLVILRSAGLVHVGPNAQGRYSLRPGTGRELQRLVDDYLPILPMPADETRILVRQ